MAAGAAADVAAGVAAADSARSEAPGELCAPGGWPGVAERAAVGGALHWRSSSLMVSTLHNAPPPKLDFTWELAVSFAEAHGAPSPLPTWAAATLSASGMWTSATWRRKRKRPPAGRVLARSVGGRTVRERLRGPVRAQRVAGPPRRVRLRGQDLVELDLVAFEAEPRAGHVQAPHPGGAGADLGDTGVPVLDKVAVPAGQGGA